MLFEDMRSRKFEVYLKFFPRKKKKRKGKKKKGGKKKKWYFINKLFNVVKNNLFKI